MLQSFQNTHVLPHQFQGYSFIGNIAILMLGWKLKQEEKKAAQVPAIFMSSLFFPNKHMNVITHHFYFQSKLIGHSDGIEKHTSR